METNKQARYINGGSNHELYNCYMFRNFGYEWGGKGTSQDPCSDIYRGSSAFSEPETQVQIGIGREGNQPGPLQ